MTDRRTAILVVIAVVAGSGVAGILLATQSSSKSARVLQIDEVNGRVGSVVLGETRENVIGALGKPGTFRGNFLGYPHFSIVFRSGHVESILTDDAAARTGQAVRIGDPLSAARASYRKAAKCNPNSPDKHAKHPFCVIAVASGLMTVDGDPIRTIELARTG